MLVLFKGPYIIDLSDNAVCNNVTWNMLDKLNKVVCRTAGPTFATSLEPFAG